MEQGIKSKIESEAIAAVENAFSKGKFTYPESYCELYETGAAFGYSLAFEGKQGWVKTKPVFDRECVFVTAYCSKDEWDFNAWRIMRVENGDGWYWGLCNIEGEEWGPIEDLSAQLYFILPSPGESSSNPSEDSGELIKVLEDINNYLSEVTYEKGQPLYLNNIGAGSILHKQVKEALSKHPSTDETRVQHAKELHRVNEENAGLKEQILLLQTELNNIKYPS